ncbi:hypothetical protein EOM75_01965 [Candidatus Falkowbacteria bacterium]|nr:hypothetical protein [Bacteroidales bacterium]MDD4177150.1 hypothetical protein [Bacteroidales bacterium]MDD4740813.1 hypothetical protein [Bacteroidales bacterium]NCU34766.1 hypothetical protein [Candidatus Falkowbacteria bacterium]
MLIIVDAKIPAMAKEALSAMGQLLELATDGIVYPAISGHPDIFFCRVGQELVVAPNLPAHYLEILVSHGIKTICGKNLLGKQYPASAHYNAVATQEYLIHHPAITDEVIKKLFINKKTLDVKQGYTRCNLMMMGEEHALTSDAGIGRVLEQAGIKTLLVDPGVVILPGFDNGFFGGCCGVWQDAVYVLAGRDGLAQSAETESFATSAGYRICWLTNEAPFDGGGIFFVDE